MIVHCNCSYEWNYKGSSEYYVSCPRCRRNVFIRKLLKKDLV